VTKATDHRPVVRRVESDTEGPLVCELTSRTIRLRPLRTRRHGPAEVEVPFGVIFIRAHMAKVMQGKPKRHAGKSNRSTRRSENR
jgi:hypothetical protein